MVLDYKEFKKIRENIIEKTIVCTSGFFDPIHPGHISCIRESKKFGDILVVVLNGDNQCITKKGKPFIPAKDRAYIIDNLRDVDYVVIYDHPTKYDSCEALEIVKPHIFTKGGDRDEAKKVPEVETDILELMLANMGEIKDYYALSKIQAKNSFRLAVSMCVIGFMLIVSSIVFLFLFKESIEIALIPAISGAIVEVIAGTTLFVYKKSLSQLNHYYASLHSNERYLSLVHLASKISENKRDEIYAEIIKTELNNCKITN